MLLAEAGTGIGKTLAISRPPRCGRSGRRHGVGFDLHQGAAAAARRRRRRGLFAEPRSGHGGSSSARAARIIFACSTSRMRCRAGSPGGRRSWRTGRALGGLQQDGDMVGGDLPGWLPSLFRRAGAAALTDRRGECVYAGCPHYRRCFIERAERAGREADIVIANHALVMVNAARGRRERADADPVRRGPSSVRRRRFDLRRRVRRAGSDRDAALDRRPRRAIARAAARACGAADGCRVL